MRPNRFAHILFLCTLLLTAFIESYSQEKVRTLEHGHYRRYDTRSEPIAVVSRHLSTQPFIDETKVMGKTDWLAELTLGIKNISSKTITDFEVNLIIPQQGDMPSPAVIILRFPFWTPVISSDGKPTGESRLASSLKPGDVIKMTAPKDQLRILEFIKEKGVLDVSSVSLAFISVKFDDGTGWFQGHPTREDPARPGSIIPLSRWTGFSRREPASRRMNGSIFINVASRQFDDIEPLRPANCGSSFFKSSITYNVSPPSGCAWFDQSFLSFCGPLTGGCPTCKYPVDLVFPNNPGGGLFGYTEHQTTSWCGPDPEAIPVEGACSSCQAFERVRWFPDSICGQPHPCPQTATWGCQSPWVNVNGVCRMPTGAVDQCIQSGGQPNEGYCYCEPCATCPESPILIDTNGDGFALSNAAEGVNFDLNGDGTAERRGWTRPETNDAWLVLDRNGDGVISNGTELFGDGTAQDEPPFGIGKNGFAALAPFDRTGHGGNNDGRINSHDAVFPSLRLWKDTNHNGISESVELYTLSHLGVTSFELDYHESRREDEHGNRFRYRAKVWDAQGQHINRWAWDVFLVTSP